MGSKLYRRCNKNCINTKKLNTILTTSNIQVCSLLVVLYRSQVGILVESNRMFRGGLL